MVIIEIGRFFFFIYLMDHLYDYYPMDIIKMQQ